MSTLGIVGKEVNCFLYTTENQDNKLDPVGESVGSKVNFVLKWKAFAFCIWLVGNYCRHLKFYMLKKIQR